MKTCKVSLLYSSQSCYLLPSHVNRDSIFLLTLLRIRFSVLWTLQKTLLLHSLNANCTITIHNTCKGVLFLKSKNVTLHFYHSLIWENMLLHIFLLFHLRRHIKKSGWCFITGPNASKQMKVLSFVSRFTEWWKPWWNNRPRFLQITQYVWLILVIFGALSILTEKIPS